MHLRFAYARVIRELRTILIVTVEKIFLSESFASAAIVDADMKSVNEFTDYIEVGCVLYFLL